MTPKLAQSPLDDPTTAARQRQAQDDGRIAERTRGRPESERQLQRRAGVGSNRARLAGGPRPASAVRSVRDPDPPRRGLGRAFPGS